MSYLLPYPFLPCLTMCYYLSKVNASFYHRLYYYYLVPFFFFSFFFLLSFLSFPRINPLHLEPQITINPHYQSSPRPSWSSPIFPVKIDIYIYIFIYRLIESRSFPSSSWCLFPLVQWPLVSQGWPCQLIKTGMAIFPLQFSRPSSKHSDSRRCRLCNIANCCQVIHASTILPCKHRVLALRSHPKHPSKPGVGINTYHCHHDDRHPTKAACTPNTKQLFDHSYHFFAP
jgi:hypothetical protein